MFANVVPTRSLRSSLYYARALREPDKGGNVIMANGVGLHMSPTAQLAMMESYCNPKFKVKAFSIVISHSDEDNERLKDPKFRERMIHEFVNSCKVHGVPLDDIPYLIPEHTNTDNDHYHMVMLVNKFDGTRINTQFLGKRMAKAAVDVSRKYGLHYPPGWDERDRRKELYEKAEAEKAQSKPLDKPKPTLPVVPTGDVGLEEEKEKKLQDRIRRRNAIQAAQKRKEDERRREEAERNAEERVKVQEQETEGREEDSEVDSELETERESRTGHRR